MGRDAAFLKCPALIIFTGLPGTGKTTLARKLARRLGAVYLRIDVIGQALANSNIEIDDWEDTGYRVGYSLAEDNLLLGRSVVADSVNPVALTRSAWLIVSEQTGSPAIGVEVVCSDLTEHQKRV